MYDIDELKMTDSFEYAHNLVKTKQRVIEQIREDMKGKDFITYTREGSPFEFPMVRFTIGNLADHLPDFVITGSTKADAVESLFTKVRYALLSRVPSHVDRILMPITELVKILNDGIEAVDQPPAFRFIPIDTEQFMYGVGMNAQRYYGDQAGEARLIQVLYAYGGLFADDARYPQAIHPQPVLPTGKFGNYKQPLAPWVKMQRDFHVSKLN